MTQNTAIRTRKQYMDREISHQDYYAQFATEETLRSVEQTFGLETLRTELAKDLHLNGIPLERWGSLAWTPVNRHGSPVHRRVQGNDSGPFRASIPFNRDAITAAGESITRATLVCIAKEAARRVVADADAA